MDKNEIGMAAGVVWRTLNNQEHWEYNQLKDATGLNDRVLSAAIGWLAREEKIDFDYNQDRLFVSLNVYIG